MSNTVLPNLFAQVTGTRDLDQLPSTMRCARCGAGLTLDDARFYTWVLEDSHGNVAVSCATLCDDCTIGFDDTIYDYLEDALLGDDYQYVYSGAVEEREEKHD
jgi:hypothetical protein